MATVIVGGLNHYDRSAHIHHRDIECSLVDDLAVVLELTLGEINLLRLELFDRGHQVFLGEVVGELESKFYFCHGSLKFFQPIRSLRS